MSGFDEPAGENVDVHRQVLVQLSAPAPVDPETVTAMLTGMVEAWNALYVRLESDRETHVSAGDIAIAWLQLYVGVYGQVATMIHNNGSPEHCRAFMEDIQRYTREALAGVSEAVLNELEGQR